MTISNLTPCAHNYSDHSDKTSVTTHTIPTMMQSLGSRSNTEGWGSLVYGCLHLEKNTILVRRTPSPIQLQRPILLAHHRKMLTTVTMVVIYCFCATPNQVHRINRRPLLQGLLQPLPPKSYIAIRSTELGGHMNQHQWVHQQWMIFPWLISRWCHHQGRGRKRPPKNEQWDWHGR